MKDTAYKVMAHLEDAHFWFLGKRLFFQAVFPKKKNHQHTILDVGAGTGGFSSFLTGYGTVTAVESHPIALSYLQKRIGQSKHTILSANINAMSLPHSHFSLITIIDVLYHKGVEEKTVLKKAYEAMAPGGTLIVMDCANPNDYSSHDELMDAKKRFTIAELKTLLEESGFRIHKASYVFFFLYPFFWLSRKYAHEKETVYLPTKLLNISLRLVTFIESKLLSFINFPFGSSLIIVATKNS